MRYTIMLQFVITITFVFIGVAALFAWLQNRPQMQVEQTSKRLLIDYTPDE